MLKFLLIFFLLVPQSNGRKSSPLDVPLSLSGNYGELRDGRFHAGLDFRVGGGVGERVYSIDGGYVEKVSVSSSGYGNAVYVRHPDGTLSIYGHLLDFAPSLAKRVKERQYKERSFSVTLVFSPDEFPVTPRTFIGRVGNSGSSIAPHLHLEIRNEDNSKPLNSVSHGYFEIFDNMPPVFNLVNFYSYNDQSGVEEVSLLYSFEGNKRSSSPLLLPSRSYIAIDADDHQNGTVAKLAIEEYRVMLDSDTIFRFKLGDYSWKEQETFCTLIDYGEKLTSGRTMLRSFIGRGNGFRDKIKCMDNGLIVLKDTLLHRLKVEVIDEHGNKSSKSFKVRKRDDKSFAAESSAGNCPCGNVPVSAEGKFVPWFAPYSFVGEEFAYTIPPAALESSVRLSIFKDTLLHSEGAFSSVWRLFSRQKVPFLKSASVKFRVQLPDTLRGKALVASVAPDGTLFPIGGRCNGEIISARVRGFGAFCVALDTIPPTIIPRFKTNSSIINTGQLTFTIRDDFSGIASYSASIDGKWILASYDEKYDKLWIVLDREIVKKRGMHELELSVTDNKNNLTIYKHSFLW